MNLSALDDRWSSGRVGALNSTFTSKSDLTPTLPSGNVHGQFSLGAAYENGIGHAKDSMKALYWYSKAAAQVWGGHGHS